MTNTGKKIVLLIIIIFVVYLIYTVSKTSSEGTSSFSDFDINSTANKNIKVELIPEKQIVPGQDGGVTFYVKDSKGTEMKVVLGSELDPEIKGSVTLILSGHSHGDYFHAVEAKLD